jgi:hypothetical protein
MRITQRSELTSGSRIILKRVELEQCALAPELKAPRCHSSIWMVARVPADYKSLSLLVASSVSFMANVNYSLEGGYFDVSSDEKWLPVATSSFNSLDMNSGEPSSIALL